MSECASLGVPSFASTPGLCQLRGQTNQPMVNGVEAPGSLLHCVKARSELEAPRPSHRQHSQPHGPARRKAPLWEDKPHVPEGPCRLAAGSWLPPSRRSLPPCGPVTVPSWTVVHDVLPLLSACLCVCGRIRHVLGKETTQPQLGSSGLAVRGSGQCSQGTHAVQTAGRRAPSQWSY